MDLVLIYPDLLLLELGEVNDRISLLHYQKKKKRFK